MKLIGELVGTLPGPIIVIGGGPSAPLALEALRDTYGIRPAAVISANEHGFKQSIYPVTHSVCCDAFHGETRQSMETLLRRHGVPIIAPHHFADIRLPEWKLAANTGLTAIAVAVFMGGAPVLVTGIDCYRVADPRAPVYFHDADAKSNSRTKHESNFRRQFEALEQYVSARAPIRFVAGNALGFYPPFDPNEALAPITPPKARYYRSLAKIIVQARPHGRVQFKLTTLEPGRLFPCSPLEAQALVHAREAKVIEHHAPPDGSPLQLPPLLARAPVGYADSLTARLTRA